MVNLDKGVRLQCTEENILRAPVPESNFYNKYHPWNLEVGGEFAFYVVFEAVRLAGLLHDVGHLPYSHILEHAFKHMYLEVKNKSKPNETEKAFLDIMKRFAEGDDEIHEEIGKLLVDNIRDSITQGIVNKADKKLYFFMATFDFAAKIVCSKPKDKTIYSNLHTITASVLDADRLDYCSRDAFCSGTNKSIYPYEGLLSTYKLIRYGKDDGNTEKGYYFCPSTKSKANIEDLLRRRMNIFAEINYHHRVHKHEILLEEVICELGLSELRNVSADTQLPYSLPLAVSSIWKLISKIDTNNEWPEYQIIQLDDSWLDTLLKTKFFEKYKEDYLSIQENGNDVLWNRFDELISATKRYHSCIKRATDFQEFDKLFYNVFEDNKRRLSQENMMQKTPDMEGFLGNNYTYNEFVDKYNSLFFNYLVDKLYVGKTMRDNFFKNFEEKLNIEVKNAQINVNDCFLRSCMFSLGYDTARTPLLLMDEKGEDPIRIEQISSQRDIFTRERAISPIFHLYYLPSYNTSIGTYYDVNIPSLIRVLAQIAFDVVFEGMYET